MEKLKFILDSVHLDQLDCAYADLRVEETMKSKVQLKDGEFQACTQSPSLGAFLRVYNNGKWFFKSTTDFSNLQADFCTLIETSRQIKGQAKDLFKEVPVFQTELIRFRDRDPRLIPMSIKKELAQSLSRRCAKFSQIKSSMAIYADVYQLKGFISSRGTRYLYDFAAYNIATKYTLRQGDNLLRSSWTRYRSDLNALKEAMLDFEDSVNERLRHLDAKPVPPGKYTVVMDDKVAGVFTHESFGHKSEADAMLGDEGAIKEWQIGALVGSPILNIVDEGGIPNSSGYVPFDDEGVPAKKNYLIKQGRLAGRLHNLDTASALGEKPTGNGRAMDFEFEPIVRMTSTYIEPGDNSFEDMISGIQLGIYVKDYWYGTGLSTFTIAPQIAYWIRDGQIAEPVKVSVISGSVFETLKNISAVSKRYDLDSSILGGCGKDEQWPLRVTDGGPDLVIRDMQVG